jgi:hypothetical protein
MSSSRPKCSVPPVPAEPNVIWPGFAFASDTSSFSVFTGIDGCTTMRLVVDMTGVSACRSRRVS